MTVSTAEMIAWIEAHPFSGAEEKELFKKGTRVRVYEKVNGYSRIGPSVLSMD